MRSLLMRAGLLSVLTIGALFATPAQPVAAFSGGGSGTSGSPYQITTCAQWLEMASDKAADYILMNDIDCDGVSYTPIGSGLDRFTGTLDGNFHTISNVTTSSSDAGIFGWIDASTVSDLIIDGATITSSGGAGVLAAAATNSSTITNVHVVNSSITSTNGYTGGLVNFTTNSAISQCSFTNGSLSAAGHPYVAGIAAQLLSSTITDCYSNASLEGNSSGGLAGATSNATITRSYSAGTFVSLGTANGGLVGLDSGSLTIVDSFSATSMSGSGTDIGAIIGDGTYTATNVYFDETLAGRSNCSGTASATCTAVNSDGLSPNYFKDNTTNLPLSNWSFGYGNPWRSTNTYPARYMFDDADGDGITDSEEQASPNSGDANNDGTPDYQQAHAASTATTGVNGGNRVAVSATGCSMIGNIQLGNEGTSQSDPAYEYQTGLLSFYALSCGSNGVSVPVTVDFYGTYLPAQVVLRKKIGSTYVAVSGATLTNLTIGGQPVLRATFTVVDGGPLDADGTADGNISDPVGLANVLAASTGAPDTGLRAAHAWYIPFVVGSCLLIIGGALFRHKQSTSKR